MRADVQTENIITAGERLKSLRRLLRVTRAYLQAKYGLPEVTLKSWENGASRLTESGAERCVEMYRQEGLIVNLEWIMHGLGLDPKLTVSVCDYFAAPNKAVSAFAYDDEEAIIRDAKSFKESYPDAVVMIINNHEMRPFYCPGDYIGGRMREGAALQEAVNRDCIVYLKDGERLFRRVLVNKQGQFNLSCLNPHETTEQPVLYDVKIESAAPVVWHRWRDCR